MAIFKKLQLWMDPVSRSGPEAMAVDEWLLETAQVPVLRVYSWEGDWASIGYFGCVAEARKLFLGMELVRRWTGGGIVDHRRDWTYTLVVPKGESLAASRGAESYRMIHEKLVETMTNERMDVALSAGDAMTGAACCFENPVGFDLVSTDGRKLAGAGQRRSKDGLLHQGSVAIPCESFSESCERAMDFSSRLSDSFGMYGGLPDPKEILRKVSLRYGNGNWMMRR